jgi:transcriptional/translational regulatory protein YebC/TACO1
VFKIAPKEGVDIEDLELELIDFGVDEIEVEEDDILLYGSFTSYSEIQNYLEDNGYEIFSAEFERIPHDTKILDAEQRTQIEKLLEKFEDDEDVQNVFHNMDETGGEEEE